MPEALAALRIAVDAVELAARDDRESIGALAEVAERHDGELAELRDELVGISQAFRALADRVASLGRTLDARTAEAA